MLSSLSSNLMCREEQERLNIWMALLNLENVYGTKEEVTKTLQRAALVTDPFTLYRRVAAMYSTSGKMEVSPLDESACYWKRKPVVNNETNKTAFFFFF